MAWPTRHSDTCLAVFCKCQAEWNIPWHGDVLEIGCAEADWLSLAARADPTLTLHGVDTRTCMRPASVFRGDVRELERPHESLDGVVLVSALEHIGLGHYQDPVFPDGDEVTLRLAWDWLRPGGHLYFDVPWTPTGPDYIERETEYRVYDNGRLNRLYLDRGWDSRGVSFHGVAGGAVVWGTDPTPNVIPEYRKWVYRACWWQKPEAA